MKKGLFLIQLFTLLFLVSCDNPQIAASDSSNLKPVAVTILAKAQASSTYRITISGPAMATIGPDEYAGGQSIELYVPEGSDRAFHFERYDQNSILTDTGTSISDIGSGMNTVLVTLASVTTGLATYTVTYDGNGNTGGSVPSAQTKTQGVALTLSGNTGSLVKTGYTFARWNTAANGSGTDYAEGASYTADANVTLYAKWTSTGITAGPTVTDADGNVYASIVIGTQTWTVENLRTTKYNDGTSIPHVTDGTEWSNLSTPGYCWYNNSTVTSEQEKWGALYNWHAVNTGKLAPAGWHVPTDAEWTTLENYLIANGYNWDGSTSGDKTGKSLAAKTDWLSSNTAGDVGNDRSSNNSTGFSALPGGFRYNVGNFYDQGTNGLWWSATEDDATDACYRYLGYDGEHLDGDGGYKKCGFSVRLVRDN
jgi:uncharacterized protein (TIGR02145 family)/uncharacterized repeat protein (TIGR02543 family)